MWTAASTPTKTSTLYHPGQKVSTVNQGWGSGVDQKPDPGLCTSNKGRFLKVYWMNILDNFLSLLFCFIFLVSDVSPVSPRAPDPVRIWADPDPGWFSESSTSIVRLTPKVLKQKRMLLKLSKIFAFKTLENLPSLEVQSPGSKSGKNDNHQFYDIFCVIAYKFEILNLNVNEAI